MGLCIFQDIKKTYDLVLKFIRFWLNNNKVKNYEIWFFEILIKNFEIIFSKFKNFEIIFSEFKKKFRNFELAEIPNNN